MKKGEIAGDISTGEGVQVPPPHFLDSFSLSRSRGNPNKTTLKYHRLSRQF
jgi:hypothetical protein